MLLGALFIDLNCTAERYRGVFKNFPYFNYVQSKVFDDVSFAIYHVYRS